MQRFEEGNGQRAAGRLHQRHSVAISVAVRTSMTNATPSKRQEVPKGMEVCPLCALHWLLWSSSESSDVIIQILNHKYQMHLRRPQ